MHAAVCNIDVKKLVFEVDNKVELVELLLVERSRSVEHNVASAVVFRERDAVADGVETGEERYPTVEAVSQTTVRRCTELEGVHQETELFCSLFWSEAQDFEHLSLQFRVVNTD